MSSPPRTRSRSLHRGSTPERTAEDEDIFNSAFVEAVRTTPRSASAARRALTPPVSDGAEGLPPYQLGQLAGENDDDDDDGASEVTEDTTETEKQAAKSRREGKAKIRQALQRNPAMAKMAVYVDYGNAQLGAKVNKMMKKLEALDAKVTKVLENQEAFMDFVVAQKALEPDAKETWERTLKIHWHTHAEMRRAVEDPDLALLLKQYVKAFVQSGSCVGFHKTFFYSLMTEELFARSFLERSGHNVNIRYGVVCEVLPQAVSNLFWSEVHLRKELASLEKHFVDVLAKMSKNARADLRSKARWELLERFHAEDDAGSLVAKACTTLLSDGVLELDLFREKKDVEVPWDDPAGLQTWVDEWHPKMSAAFAQKYSGQDKVDAVKRVIAWPVSAPKPGRRAPQETQQSYRLRESLASQEVELEEADDDDVDVED